MNEGNLDTDSLLPPRVALTKCEWEASDALRKVGVERRLKVTLEVDIYHEGIGSELAVGIQPAEPCDLGPRVFVDSWLWKDDEDGEGSTADDGEGADDGY